MFALTAVAVGLYMFFMVRAGRRLTKTVLDANGCVCIDCGYPLEELRLPRACPECGLAVPPDRHASVWKELGFPVK
jgi:predicted amidophosphoribosyltransferase